MSLCGAIGGANKRIMIKIDDQILANLEMLKSCTTDNEKLAIMADVADLQSRKIEHMHIALGALQGLFTKVVYHHMPNDHTRKDYYVNFDYKSWLDSDEFNT